ncbi:MAG: hypothetical protein KDK08_28735 [Rhizobiaceae bacterium]|nr:hypothetical protein [Rhizobiaceae bacterium]
MRVSEVITTPIAIPDAPMAHTKGIHPSAVLRAEIKVKAVAELHDLYNRTIFKDRGDTDEMLKYLPNYVRNVPRC